MSFFGKPAATAVKDTEVSDPPTDSISCIAWSPVADYLAVGSWDCNVRIYEVAPNGQTQGKAMYTHEGPVLDVCWTKDGTKVISGSADKTARAYDMATGQATQVAAHDEAIKCCRWADAPAGGYLVTGSWDKTMKYWNLGSPAPIATVTLPERCYSIDIAYPLMVVGTAERHILVFDLNNPQTPFKKMESPLKWQTRCVVCFPKGNGFAVGSVEGRCAIQYVEDKDAASNFSFKCHRKEAPGTKKTEVYSVNSIVFHPREQGSFATAGADGNIVYWDKDQRQRLKAFDQCPGPITAVAFNRTGAIFAYAISYDWSKGHTGVSPPTPNKIMLHPVTDDEVKKKTDAKKSFR
ncbi:hypothetical protein M422DRAFT_222885 [Sphaerobolus stellatus SS14]|nr:hypothetical protein M422DRAFT_222885 [Sphaerobolus stellatus SS14]